jgi:hypothetical protein
LNPDAIAKPVLSKEVTMKRVWLLMIVGLAFAGGANAEVRVEIHSEPLVQSFLDERDVEPPVGGLVGETTKGYAPADAFWFIPLFKADMAAPGDTTYFSVQNHDSSTIDAVVQYYDVRFALQATETIEIAPHELAAIALRDVPGLPVDADGYARGMVRISPTGPVYVDSFQLETRESFAVGGEGFVTDDFCEMWYARFLRFAAAGGTQLVFLVNGPQGGDPGDPVTVSGDVYAENGDFINSFTVRTDEWSFEIPVHDYVLGGVDFGTVELAINASFSPAGLVQVNHKALGEYSVGHLATCAD